MTVRYNPVYSVILIVIGAVDVVLALAVFSTSGSVSFAAVIGVLIIIGGITQLKRAYFEFDPATTTIAIKGRGNQPRQFGGADGGLLFVEGDRVFCTSVSGGRKRVPVTRFLARAEQWNVVIEQIRHAPVTGPAPL